MDCFKLFVAIVFAVSYFLLRGAYFGSETGVYVDSYGGCLELDDVEVRDSCILRFALMDNESSYCAGIENTETLAACYGIIAEWSNNVSICYEIDDHIESLKCRALVEDADMDGRA